MNVTGLTLVVLAALVALIAGFVIVRDWRSWGTRYYRFTIRLPFSGFYTRPGLRDFSRVGRLGICGRRLLVSGWCRCHSAQPMTPHRSADRCLAAPRDRQSGASTKCDLRRICPDTRRWPTSRRARLPRHFRTERFAHVHARRPRPLRPIPSPGARPRGFGTSAMCRA